MRNHNNPASGGVNKLLFNSVINTLTAGFMYDTLQSMNDCIYPGCYTSVYARKLCERHYMTAAQLVHRRQATWALLEKAGKVGKADGKKGRPRTTSKFFTATK
jgi:hypothetical protein